MANYTQHYHLHQWEPEDSFLRTDFNGDFQRLDEALAGLDGRKPELRLGRYTGDGTQNRAVALGCAPRAVLLFCRDREALLAWPGAPYVYAYKNRPGNMLILTETGFQVHYDHYEVGLSDNDFLPVTNKAGGELPLSGPGIAESPRTQLCPGASQLFLPEDGRPD